MTEKAPTVAVLGLGALGLVSMKNMLEEGFIVTGLEKNPYVGGLWHYNENGSISVLESTITNGSKHRGCFTDFPFPDGTPDFPTAADMANYLASYAEHFGLTPHMRLNTLIRRAEWSQTKYKWEVEISPVENDETTTLEFDKVIHALGPDQVPNIPKVSGIENFSGDVRHSLNFKKAEDWAGKRVVVAGFGNTAADIAGVLVGVASKVYLSHRRGAIVLPRWVNGRPIDHHKTYRKTNLLGLMSRFTPGLWKKIMDNFVLDMRNRVYRNLKPEWRLDPAPSFNQQRPVVSDNLIDNLSSGGITSLHPIQEIKVDGRTVEMTDGTTVEADAIIWCTGYRVDFSMLGDSDPTIHSTCESANGRKVPRLYQNVFSLQNPESLVFMGNLSFMNPAMLMFDLASMAVAQIWKGASALPSPARMERQVNDHHAWLAHLSLDGPVTPGLTKGIDWLEWVDEAAGLGMGTHLGYGWHGWSFWFNNRRLCNMLMDGLSLPPHYRLFDAGKRKPWPGAQEEILKINTELEAKGWHP